MPKLPAHVPKLHPKHEPCQAVCLSSTNAKWGYIWRYLSGGPANKSKRISYLAAEFDPRYRNRTGPEAWLISEAGLYVPYAKRLRASFASRHIAGAARRLRAMQRYACLACARARLLCALVMCGLRVSAVLHPHAPAHAVG